MIYLFIFSLLIIFYFLIRYPKNIYAILFSLEVLAITMLLVANIIYIVRIRQFSYNTMLEFRLMILLSRIPLSVFEVRTVVNAALFIFFFASAMLQIHDIKYTKNCKLKLSLTALLTATVSFEIFYFNSPSFLTKIYIRNHIASMPSTYIAYCLSILNIMVLCSCMLPCCKLLWSIMHSKIMFKKRHLTLLLLTHTFLLLIFISILYFMPIGGVFNNFNIYKFSTGRASGHFASHYLIITVLLLLISTFAMLVFNFNVLDEKVFNVKLSKKNNSFIVIQDLRHIFHSYKNVLFSIKLLANSAIENFGKEEALEALNKITSTADVFINKASHFLNVYNKVDLGLSTILIQECITDACARSSIPTGIQLKVLYLEPDLAFYGDKELMTEVFVNLLNNAAEAISKKNAPDVQITITVWSEIPWLCIDISDNGTGMPRRIQRKIFNPLFSTKKNLNNWGVGLSYAKNIVSSHSGYINFKSIKNKYTSFQVALLLEKPL